MPIPSPKGEPKKNFLSKCMGDSVMVKEFPDEKQRYAVCQSKWSKASDIEWQDEDKNSDIIIINEKINIIFLCGLCLRGE